MEIKWIGHSCFMVTSDKETKILMDPYKNFLGYKFPKVYADIVTTSHNHSDHNNVDEVKGDFKHINTAGKFIEKDIEIIGVETFHDNASGAKRGKNIIYKFIVDDLRLCHCGDLGHLLNDDKIKSIGDVDILFLPVGGGSTVKVNDAFLVSKQLNPKIIIPMHYRTKALGIPGYIFKSVNKFVSISGLSYEKLNTIKISKSNIDGFSKIIILNYL